MRKPDHPKLITVCWLAILLTALSVSCTSPSKKDIYVTFGTKAPMPKLGILDPPVERAFFKWHPNEDPGNPLYVMYESPRMVKLAPKWGSIKTLDFNNFEKIYKPKDYHLLFRTDLTYAQMEKIYNIHICIADSANKQVTIMPAEFDKKLHTLCID